MSKRPTIVDVARLAGVSRATAARVVAGDQELVREETRVRVIEAVRMLGYERNAVAGSLRTNQTFMVALCIPDITNPFWPEVARGVQDAIQDKGYMAATVNSDWNVEREERYLRMVKRNRFDGLIISPSGSSNADLRALDIPVVVLGNGTLYPDFDSIGTDSEQGVEEGLEHLYALGHRRIGLIAGQSTKLYSYSRYHGYTHFCARRGLPFDEALIVICEFNDQMGFAAMQQLMELASPPSAVFCANDLLALGALRFTEHKGLRVPEDVSIIGMDDIYVASRTSPSLTTVAKKKYETGTGAAALLLERLRKAAPNTARHILLPCSLVVRQSTGLAPRE